MKTRGSFCEGVFESQCLGAFIQIKEGRNSQSSLTARNEKKKNRSEVVSTATKFARLS